MAYRLNLVDTPENHNYQYHIIGIVDRKHLVPILIDTGASWSHISRNLIDQAKIKPLKHIRSYSDYRSTEHILKEYTNINLKLASNQTFEIDIIIDEQPNKFLLGTDFLEAVNYTLNSNYIIINGEKQNRYKLHEESIRQILG